MRLRTEIAVLAAGLSVMMVLGVAGIYFAGRAAGAESVQRQWDLAKAEAQALVDAQVAGALDAHVHEVEVIRTVYRDRIKEVKVYVPSDNSCPADAEFVRLFNGSN